MRTAKTKRNTKRRKPGRVPLSIDNPPTGYTMSIRELAELDGSSRNTAYAAVAAGRYPALSHGRNIRVLTVPALAILRGERPPGPLPDDPARITKKRRPVKKKKPAARRAPSTPATASP